MHGETIHKCVECFHSWCNVKQECMRYMSQVRKMWRDNKWKIDTIKSSWVMVYLGSNSEHDGIFSLLTIVIIIVVMPQSTGIHPYHYYALIMPWLVNPWMCTSQLINPQFNTSQLIKSQAFKALSNTSHLFTLQLITIICIPNNPTPFNPP